MKFTADRAELAEAVKWVAGAISPNPSIPTLGGVFIETRPGNQAINLTAHDYDKVYWASIHVSDDESVGDIAIPAGLVLRDILGALKAETVTLAADERRLSVVAGRSKYGVNLFPADTWPEFPFGDVTHRGTVDADDLRAAVKIVNAAADDDNPREVARGVRLDGDIGALSLVGFTSSALMSTAELPWDGAKLEARLPIKSFAAAAQGLSGNVDISTSDGLLQLTDKDRSVTLRLYEGAAGAGWRGILNRTAPVEFEVDAEELRDAVKRAALAGGKDAVLTITVDSGTATISGAGESADGIEVVDVVGDGSHTGAWAVDVLGSVLAVLPPTPVTLILERTASGSSVLALTDKAGSFHHVVMGRRS